MKISILTSAHKHDDDRLYHHFAKSLSKKGHLIDIVSNDCDLDLKNKISFSSFNGINYTRKEKIKIFINKLSSFNPDLIICLEPITVIASKKFSRNKNINIIYDITEWYPSKNQIKSHRYGTKLFYSFLYFGLFLYACYQSNGFIFGEYYKSLIPKLLFPKKENTQISYYPDFEYIKKMKPDLQKNVLRLCYSGNLNIEKGMINFLNVLKDLINNNSNLKIHIKLIGEFDPVDKKKCFDLINELEEKINFSFYDFQELSNYISLIKDTDIFLDLRTLDFINSHSLPIKLFYYMGLQRPVIYTDLKTIRKEIEIDSFGYLVNPEDSKKIAELITNYQNNESLYYSHCSNAKDLYELRYNWKILEENFIRFIEGFRSNNE